MTVGVHRTEKSGSAVEAGAEFIGCGTVAAVSSMRVHLTPFRPGTELLDEPTETVIRKSPAGA